MYVEQSCHVHVCMPCPCMYATFMYVCHVYVCMPCPCMYKNKNKNKNNFISENMTMIIKE